MTVVQKKMKLIWFIIALGLLLINASEYEQFKKTIVGKYIYFNYHQISLAEVTAQSGKEFQLEEFSGVFMNDDVPDTWPFNFTHMTNESKIRLSDTFSLSLRENGNIHLYLGKGDLAQVMYKFPDKCNFKDVKASVQRLLHSTQYNQSSFELNQKFLQEHVTDIFTDSHIGEIMTEKIVKEDPNRLSPPKNYEQKYPTSPPKSNDQKYHTSTPKTEDQKHPTLLHCGFGLVIFGLVCLLLVHPYLSRPLAAPFNEETNSDTSFVNKINVAEDNLKDIYVEPRYLSRSTFSSSSSKLSSKQCKSIMKTHFRSTSASSESPNNGI